MEIDPQLLDTVFRLGSAALVGACIGLNRDLMNKPIGTRTLGLVSVGAAVISLAAIEFQEMAGHPDAMSRVLQGIIQGVLTGIGFIGAGVILRDPAHQHVQGLTTAASVWVTAALGVACALAAWRIVAVGVVIVLVLLVLIPWLEARLSGQKRE